MNKEMKDILEQSVLKEVGWKNINPKFLEDEEFVSALMDVRMNVFENLSDGMKEKVYDKALKINLNNYRHFPEALKENKGFLIKIMNEHSSSRPLMSTPMSLAQDVEVLRVACKFKDFSSFSYLEGDIIYNKPFMLELLSKCPTMNFDKPLKYLEEQYHQDNDNSYILSVLEISHIQYKKLSKKSRENELFIETAIKTNSMVYNDLDPEKQKEFKYIKMAMNSNVKKLIRVDRDFWKSSNIKQLSEFLDFIIDNDLIKKDMSSFKNTMRPILAIKEYKEKVQQIYNNPRLQIFSHKFMDENEFFLQAFNSLLKEELLNSELKEVTFTKKKGLKF